MNRFDWQAQLAKCHASFPAATHKPVIAITGNYGEGNCKLAQTYYKSVEDAGGVPIIMPPSAQTDTIINTLEHIDGLLISGGSDFNPLFAGEQPVVKLGGINAERDLAELLTIRLAYDRQIPMLAICRGIQALAMALDGHVEQDISHRAQVKHSQDADRSEPTHSVKIVPDSILGSLYADTLKDNDGILYVNSFHHQAVDQCGPRFRTTAESADGIIEAIENREYKSIIGVQWHPECLVDGAPLFQWLVKESEHFYQACKLHERIITLDTHCDTPMFFPQGVDFGSRDKKILVDLHKMTEGHQDATIMVAYLPQPKPGEDFPSIVDFDVKNPTEYADLIFDKIETMVAHNKSYLSIARTPADLYANKKKGLKSIMLGIENGLAINGDLRKLRHFAERGIVYMTLCHNGDNDICDSARGCNTHGGVSDFGQQVIRKMNKLGIMVDMSHAGEHSFYDALDISQQPIVCSHSSCRALCDHPRNLTDDQMRQLAAKGGVMQVTLYNGFLCKDGEATVLDALAHLDHAINIMGIDHVGLGSDFDGDGGIRGLSCSSEMINFTRHLMAKRYSERDIQKIWGRNFLRIMKQVQSAKS